jgi:hypothetical protein
MANSKEIGATGLAQFSGLIQADFLREMRGIEAWKRFNEMRLNNAVVGSLLLAIRQPVLAMEWTFASTEGETDNRLEILNAAKNNMSSSWGDHVGEALLFLPFGYYPFEICYERGDKGMLWHKFSPRGQDTITRWKFSDDGSLEGFYQRVNYTEEKFIPIDKTLLYRINVERNNPEGRSILRTAWISYYYAKHIAQAEAIGIERGMDGFPVITLPEGASTDDSDPNSDAAKAAEFVRNIRNDEQAGLVMPFGWMLELLAPGAQSRLDADKVIRRYEARILMSALAQFLNLGQEGVGSLALSKDQTDFFAMSINATADVISDAVTKFAIPRLMKLNGYDAEGLSLEHSPATQEDTAQIISIVTQVFPHIATSAEDQVWVRQLLRMPERNVEDIQAEMDEKEAEKEAMRQMFMERGGDKSKDKDAPFAKEREQVEKEAGKDKEKNPPFGKYALFAASAPDEKTRLQWERTYKKALGDALEKSKKRVLKEARKYRQ